MTSKEKTILEGLIAGDEKITRDFLYTECRPMISAVARQVFGDGIALTVPAARLYEFLMADDARKLRSFAKSGSKNSLHKWLRGTAESLFTKEKRSIVIESKTGQRPCSKKDCADGEAAPAPKKSKPAMNVAAMIDMVELERDRIVLERIDIEGMSYDNLEKELGISKANLYNIRKRALERLKTKARIALCETDALCAVKCEQYILDMFGIHKPLLELKTLAETCGWLTETGVAIEDLGKIPKQYGLGVRRSKSDLRKIYASLDAGKQILAVVDGGELVGNPFEEKFEDTIAEIPDHVVVVLNVDLEESTVMLFDPAFGDIPLTVTAEKFLDAWHDSGNHAVEFYAK